MSLDLLIPLMLYIKCFLIVIKYFKNIFQRKITQAPKKFTSPNVLPNEVVLEILIYLDFEDLKTVAKVNQRYKHLSNIVMCSERHHIQQSYKDYRRRLEADWNEYYTSYNFSRKCHIHLFKKYNLPSACMCYSKKCRLKNCGTLYEAIQQYKVKHFEKTEIDLRYQPSRPPWFSTPYIARKINGHPFADRSISYLPFGNNEFTINMMDHWLRILESKKFPLDQADLIYLWNKMCVEITNSNVAKHQILEHIRTTSEAYTYINLSTRHLRRLYTNSLQGIGFSNRNDLLRGNQILSRVDNFLMSNHVCSTKIRGFDLVNVEKKFRANAFEELLLDLLDPAKMK